MKYSPHPTNKFKKELKTMKKRNYPIDELQYVIEQLAEKKELSSKYRDHQLTGNWKNYRECHINPDWLLIYRYEEDKLILILERTGTHSDLF